MMSVSFKSDTTGFTRGTVTAYLSGTPQFLSAFSEVHVAQSLVFSWYFDHQINTTGATSGARTTHSSGAPEFTPGFQWGSCYSIFSFVCMFCGLLFVLFCFFFWPLCCLFFFDIRILIALLVSSSSSFMPAFYSSF